LDGIERLRDALVESPREAGPGVPKYVSLFNEILKLIESGVWKPGDQLPAEDEIARSTPVSLGTVQKALRMLADHGVVVRRHGHGTFVAGTPADRDAVRNYRFLDEDGRSVLPVYVRILAIEAIDASGPWSEFLPDESEYVRLTRTISVNLEFQVYSQLYLPKSRFGTFLDFPAQQFEGESITTLLGRQFNTPVIRVVHRLRTGTIVKPAARLIGVADGTTGWFWEMFGYTLRNAPISYQAAWVPPNTRQLELCDPPPRVTG